MLRRTIGMISLSSLSRHLLLLMQNLEVQTEEVKKEAIEKDYVIRMWNPPLRALPAADW